MLADGVGAGCWFCFWGLSKSETGWVVFLPPDFDSGELVGPDGRTCVLRATLCANVDRPPFYLGGTRDGHGQPLAQAPCS